MKLPEEWPIVDPEDMLTGEMYEGGDPEATGIRRCFVGWMDVLFDSPYPYVSRGKNASRVMRVKKYILLAAKQLYGVGTKIDRVEQLDLVELNDNVLTSDKQRARVWNRAGALLKYTEGNPEAKLRTRKNKG